MKIFVGIVVVIAIGIFVTFAATLYRMRNPK